MRKRKAPKRLNKVWEECLRMWKDIMSVIDFYGTSGCPDVDDFKIIWLILNGYDPDQIDASCFFCQYSMEHITTEGACLSCPGKLVDDTFYCVDGAYSYDENPRKFYVKLLELDRERTRNGRKR